VDHAGDVVFIAGLEGGPRIDHHERKGHTGVEIDEAVDEGGPLSGPRPALEGTTIPADALCEIEGLIAAQPVLGVFLGNDDGPAGGQRKAGQVAAGLEAREEDRSESGLAGFPEAGQQGDGAGREVALP